MVHSLGLTLYTLRPRPQAGRVVQRAARPGGPLVWLHAPTADCVAGLAELARTLMDEDGCAVVLTCPEVVAVPIGVLYEAPPEDDPADIRAFFDHWRPQVVVFSDGELRPAALHEADERRIPALMLDARTPYILRGRDGWYPGLVRSSLQSFQHVIALDEASARSFRRAGAAQASVRAMGRLEEESAALPCLEAERAALAKLLATRPVWLASGLPEAEEAAVIAAHRSTLSLAHRLLLIIAPQEAERADALAARLAQEEGWVVARRAQDEEPEPDVEVFITDGMTELGLWYRLAPITFLGGSLAGKGCLRNPMEPAALGSAILYGPRPGPHGSSFGRLGAARAARAVGNGRDLAEALADLMAPDKAARLAQSAWGVASAGADVTAHVLDLIRDLMARAG
ncbi:3-deoxy-D-manno-octulosonic acid transferase [Pseudotabrizicola sp. L79]|uniref:3-deoxy-D-manno-octulosonic acid transferase n=1 Tax=Pseudotabrizicola sp. L79 TaxID=3118402 RepID=UPI002F935A3F